MTIFQLLSPQGTTALLLFRLRHLAVLLLAIYCSYGLSAQNCSLERGPGAVVAQDYDLNQGPYLTDVDIYASGLNPSVTVTSSVTFTICFWGDMGGSTETFDVTIAGVTFNTGGFGGSSPTANAPACRNFTVPASNIDGNLADGDIDIFYDNFGAGWVAPPADADPPNPPLDEFNARVQPFEIEFDIDPSITNPSGAFVCQNEAAFSFASTPANGTAGGVGSYSITPASAALNTTTGSFDPAAAEPGNYLVTYRFEYEGCTFTQSTFFEVVPLPVATLEDAVAGCNSTSYDLTNLFTDATLEGGTFSTTTPGASISGTTVSFSINGSACVDITYTLENPGGCAGATTTGTASIFFPEAVRPDFSITSATSCWDGTAPLAVEIDYFNPDYTVSPVYEWTEFSTGVNVIIGNPTSASDPMITLEQEGTSTSGTVQLCLSETITSTGACSTGEDCSALRCRSFTVTIAPCNEECGLFSAPPAICPLLTNPSFAFEILGQTFAFGSPGAELFEASVTPSGIAGSEDAILSCTEPGIEVNWAYGLNEDLFPSVVFDVPLSTIVPPVAAYCRVATFGFDFPSGFCGDCGPLDSPNLCVDILVVEPCILIDRVEPLAFLNFDLAGLGPICDITGRELIVDPLQQLVQETAVAVVWADTDGDGAFDYVLEQGSIVLDGSGSGTAFVPNNVQGEGTITVRNLTASIIPPYSPCVAPEGQGLLELLPIGFIPVVGPIIEQALTTLGLDINIAPSANFDLPIRVVNDQEPMFLNFPSQYVFNQAGDCSTPINFSTPIAVDACTGDIIENVIQISGPASGDVLAIPNPDSIGTDNPNTYEVTYRAISCNGTPLDQTFSIRISSNDPLLQCSEDITIKNDVDACSKVITGISPLQGAGCNNTITWTAPGATPASGNDDASGSEFPVGVTTVTYTLTYADQNGDTQSQTCNFDVTVVDAQAPTALCRDFEIQIGADGQAEVTVADINGGSYDNCPGDLLIDLARTDMVFGPTVAFDCFDEGQQTVILRVTDEATNERRCLGLVTVTDFFSDYELALDVPELCIEANNPEQLNFSNYLVITDGEGNTTSPLDEMNDGDMVGGMFSISGFNSSIDGVDVILGTSVDEPGTTGYINPINGQYTPGTGTGFVEITYIIVIDGGVRPTTTGIEGCYKMVTDIFELRQPLAMDEPECECIVQNDRVVNLGEITGGLEPYTIQYGGVKLDFDGDGISDEQDGEFIFEGVINGTSGAELIVDITDFTQDLGNLLVDYTQPTWFFTVVDARGCELFRSGSCDNDDENGTPEILCEDLGPVDLFTEDLICEANHTWAHTLPTDNCDVILYTYTITNPDGSTAGPFDLTALLNPDITNPLPDQFNGSYNFQHVSPTQKTSTVTYYAEDAVGNFTQCSFEVTVTDNDPPRFINCPEPAVIVDAPDTWCSAFANYSLPLAEDNCSIPVVTQVDDTGLTSGDLYPVGITINTFEAVDPSGNRTRCDVKIIVNDFHTPPTYDCPENVAQDTDLGDCGAVVDDIAPSNIADNCLPNLTIVYRIDDAEGNEVASGFDDASGNFFGLGENTVRYSVQDMPLLLITEVTHDLGNTVDGTLPVPAFTAGNPADGDYLEITNFNRSAMDVSCLMITRSHAGNIEEYAVPTFTILEPGGTLTIHFGDGINSPADDFFNVPGAANLAAGEPAAYTIGLSRSVIDVAVMNGFDLTGTAAAAYWTGTTGPVNGAGIIRTTVWDTNTAADFAPGEACLPTTIGSLNPGLAQPTPNGAATAIQAQPTVRVECDFTVTISDEEDATCGLYGEWNDYGSGAIDVAYGECVETIYTVGEAYTVSDVNLNIAGLAGDMGNLTFTLISPEGTEVELAAAVCAGTNEVEFTFDGDFGPAINAGCGMLNDAGDLIMPIGDIEIFNGEAAAGDWVLQIGHNGQQNLAPAAFASSILFVSSREAYPDYTATLENDLGVCGADYTWNHAILFDNCPGGTILWTIVDSSGTTLESQAIPIFPENTEVTFFFPVGISTVTYALTDANGNTSSCSFDVTVDDTEDPVIVCPEDVTIQLDGGECERSYRPTPDDYTATDNCAVVDIFGDPPFGQPLPIGVNPVDFTAVDAAGNDTTCTYLVTILEYIPDNPQMACIDQINIHLDDDCEQVVIPAMVLAGREYYCFDNYVFTLLQRNDAGTFDTIVPNVVGVDQIGEEVRYQIYDPRNDVSCWGRIDVGFFEAPEFICPPNVTVSCNASTDTSLMGVPVLQSCALAGATVAFADTLQRNDACDDPRAILRRTWKVTDEFGNAASCVQTITIEAFDLSTVNFPANRDGDASPAVYCAAAAADPTLTDPENTGFPFVDDGSDIFTTNFCSASYLYSDEVYNICAGSYEILRTWKVRNTCQPVVPGVNPIEAVQIIRVLDFENPVLTCADDITISTSSIDCNGAYLIPEPVVETGCTNWEYTVSVSNGLLSQLPNGTYLISGLDEGVYTIRYEVEDECGRYSECIFNLTVVDQVGPTAACEDGLNVSLDGNGQAIISADDVDGNSEDLCGEVQLEIRRLYELDATNCAPITPFYTDWSPSIGVSCCDLEAMVTVELQVTDEDGNSSVCWTEILVEDKIAPTCIAPDNVTITCVDYIESLPNDIADATEGQLDALFGFAGGADNCSVEITQAVSGSINNCGVGQLVRTFTATDGSGLTNGPACSQLIDIVSVFDYQVTLPMDVSGTCAEIPEYDDLEFTDFGCDLLTVTTNVDTLMTLDAGEECFKLRITYDAVNWCEFNSLGDPYLLPRDGHNGRNPETELLYLNVTPGDDINVSSDDDAFLSRFADRVFNSSAPQSDRRVDDGNDIDGTDDDNGETDAQAYAQDDSRGSFRYVQYIKVYDEVAPVITVTQPDACFGGNGDNCTAVVTLSFTAEDECSDVQVTAQLDVDFDETLGFQPSRTLTAQEVSISVTGEYVIRLNGAPVGAHAVRINAADGCGNFDNAILEFCVDPVLAPTPICIQTLTVTLSDDGEGGGIAAIWASDFIASPITDCFGNEIDTYSLYAEEVASAAGFLVEENQQGVMITCAELEASNGSYPVRLYAFDAAGNNDYCTVIVEIQQNASTPCDGDGALGALAGVIVDGQMNTIEGVTVSLEGSGSTNADLVTTEDGTFRFFNLPLGQDYTISPSHYEDFLNGVRTSDIVGITAHILSTNPLNSPYKLIAADVDGNASIDVGDIISIRRLILGQIDGFPANMPSWMFVPAEYEFPASLNPWETAFPTVSNHNDFVGNILDVDFIGVKLGDVNESARSNAQAPGIPRSLNGTLELEVEEIVMTQGESYRVPVMAAALTEVDGYQFTLEFDQTALEITDIEPGLVAASNFGWSFAERGLITTSWNWTGSTVPANWTGEEVLFTLVVRANAGDNLSEGLDISSRFTAAEAYERNTGDLRNLTLVFNEVNVDSGANELFQNTPNPVRNQTVISFQLATAEEDVVIAIRDAAGRIVREFKQEGTAGYNSIVVDNRMLNNAAGVYSYTVTAGAWMATKRMIILR
ncbi:MAG: HYR domain-containing protein [Lewinella sp.]